MRPPKRSQQHVKAHRLQDPRGSQRAQQAEFTSGSFPDVWAVPRRIDVDSITITHVLHPPLQRSRSRDLRKARRAAELRSGAVRVSRGLRDGEMEDAGEIGDDGGSGSASGESAERGDVRDARDKSRRHVRSRGRRLDLVAASFCGFAVVAESALRSAPNCRVGADARRRIRRVGAAHGRIARDALKVWQQEPRQQQRQQQLQLQPERLAERQSAAERPRRAAAA